MRDFVTYFESQTSVPSRVFKPVTRLLQALCRHQTMADTSSPVLLHVPKSGMALMYNVIPDLYRYKSNPTPILEVNSKIKSVIVKMSKKCLLKLQNT